jgi:hypothetical protein
LKVGNSAERNIWFCSCTWHAFQFFSHTIEILSATSSEARLGMKQTFVSFLIRADEKEAMGTATVCTGQKDDYCVCK